MSYFSLMKREEKANNKFDITVTSSLSILPRYEGISERNRKKGSLQMIKHHLLFSIFNGGEDSV